MKLANLVLLAGTTATLAQEYTSESSYGDASYKAPSSDVYDTTTSYGSNSGDYGASSSYRPSYESGPSYGGSSYSGSSHNSYPQQKSSYSYDSKMPSYGKSTTPFVDAW